MGRRQLLLRVMLWSLGLSAMAGVAAVLLGGKDVIWRVAGTGATAAVASGLLLAASRLVDREITRPAGLLAMAATIAEFLLALALIWEVAPWNATYFDWERVGLTAVAVALAALPAVFFLSIARRPGAGPAGWAGVGLCAASFAAMLAGAWWPDGTWTVRGHWWSTAGILGWCGLPGVAALAGTPLSRRPWRWVGVAAAVVAAAMAVAGEWLGLHRGGEALACVISLAAVLGYWNLALLAPLTASQRWVRWVAMAAALAAGALIDVMVITHQESAADPLERAAGASGIVAACAGLALLILARLNRRVQPVVAADLSDLTVVCPRCRKHQTIPVGGAACAGCGLRIHVRIEEPRCGNCGYLLYGITSDKCPECGTPVAGPSTAEPDPTSGESVQPTY